MPVLLDNDANCAARAEAAYGAAVGARDALVITLGTGVGCAVFFDGALLPHMELSHGRFGDGLSIEVGCGDHERDSSTSAVAMRVLDGTTSVSTAVRRPGR